MNLQKAVIDALRALNSIQNRLDIRAGAISGIDTADSRRLSDLRDLDQQIKNLNDKIQEIKAPMNQFQNDHVYTRLSGAVGGGIPHDATLNIPPKAQPKDPSTMSVKELKIAVRDRGLASKAVKFTEKSEFVALLKDY